MGVTMNIPRGKKTSGWGRKDQSLEYPRRLNQPEEVQEEKEQNTRPALVTQENRGEGKRERTRLTIFKKKRPP